MIEDYQITKQANKQAYYKNQPSIRWSPLLKRWLCFDPDAIKLVLQSNEFNVHDYSVDELAKRFNINLEITQDVLNILPLAHEGEIHQNLRREFIKRINSNFDLAISNFKLDLDEIATALNSSNDCIDIIPLLHSAVMRSNAILAGLPAEIADTDFRKIGTTFDDTLSIKNRMSINSVLEILYKKISNELSHDEKITRLAILTVGTNAILGSISESLLISLQQNPTGNFSRNHWDIDLPATGIAIIERIANVDTEICDIKIKNGESVRCYIENLGYTDKKFPHYTPLYFAATTKHVCPGMKFSLEIWKILTSTLRNIDRNYSLIDFEHRSNDQVFNFPIKIRLKID